MVIIVVMMNCCILYSEEVFVSEWKKKPTVPAGWQKISQIEGDFNSDGKTEIAFLCSDGYNDIIIIAERSDDSVVHYVFLETTPTKINNEYLKSLKSSKSSQLGLTSRNGSLVYGQLGSDAICIYRWNKQKKYYETLIPSRSMK
jgi:hypothetical protein